MHILGTTKDQADRFMTITNDLWNYLTGIEFRQRVEAIYEAYQQQRIEIQKERDWFTKKWAKEEKNTQLVLENILGMHGDLEGIVGKTLPEIKGLKMLLE